VQDVDRHSDKHRPSSNRNGNNASKHSPSKIFQLHIINTHTQARALTHTHTRTHARAHTHTRTHTHTHKGSVRK